MREHDQNGIMVNCPNCGVYNRIRPHAPSVSPLCGRCGHSLGKACPRSANANAKSSKSYGNLYGMLAVGAVLGVFILLGFVDGFKYGPSASQKSDPAQPQLNRRLSNGTMIRSAILDGNGHLHVENGLDRDAVVKLVRADSTQCVAFFYVASKATHEIKGIPDGQYNLLFCSGKDWDESKQSFTRDKVFKRFVDPRAWFTMKKTTREGTHREYIIRTVTLHPVRGGKAKTDPASEGDFAQY